MHAKHEGRAVQYAVVAAGLQGMDVKVVPRLRGLVVVMVLVEMLVEKGEMHHAMPVILQSKLKNNCTNKFYSNTSQPIF
jgi:hypothetical protein